MAFPPTTGYGRSTSQSEPDAAVLAVAYLPLVNGRGYHTRPRPHSVRNPDIPMKPNLPAVANTTSTEPAPPSLARITLFYLPLVVLAVSQSLTYPLVGSIVSKGPLGDQEFTSYAIGQQVLFLIGSLGFGLITTGMMFSKSMAGLRNYLKMNQGIAVTSALLQLVVCLPGPDQFVFGSILGLNGEMLRLARNSLLCCIPLQYIFFVRNPYLAILYNAKRSGLTNYATLMRIALAVFFAWAFPKIGWVGWGWGVVANTLPAYLETGLTWYLARPFIRALPELLEDDPPAPCRRQLAYTIPLTAGGLLLSASTFMISVFFARTASPALFLPVHLFVVGIVNPVSFSALRMQTVTVAFRPARWVEKRRIAEFGICVGVVLAFVPLLFSSLRGAAHWYFCSVQSLPEWSLWMARRTMACTAVFPIIFAMRGFTEGSAAIRYRTDAVMHGQTAYFLALVGTLFLCLQTLPAAERGANGVPSQRPAAQSAKPRGAVRADAEAEARLRSAAEQGQVDAQFQLGMDGVKHGRKLLKNQEPEPANEAFGQAADWFLRASDQGYAAAQCELGKLYLDGLGVEKDDETAARWIAKAADTGYIEAQFMRGWMFELGRGCVPSGEKAAELRCLASSRGRHGYLWGILAIAMGALSTIVVVQTELALRRPGNAARRAA